MDTRAATFGGVQPCPECGSDRVKWRGRRLYDKPLTWMRGSVEVLLKALGLGRRYRATPDIRQLDTMNRSLSFERLHGRPVDPDNLTIASDYEHERAIHDEAASFATARRFWRCAGCRESGAVFDQNVEAAARAAPFDERTR